MIRVNENISINENEISLEFTKSPGPGGQNVNKVSTSARLRFNAAASPSLPEDVRRRLIQQSGRRVTKEGILIIEARRHRSQERNRSDALDRLIELIRQAALPQKHRHKTRPSAGSRHKRLQEKKNRSNLKQMRRRVEDE